MKTQKNSQSNNGSDLAKQSEFLGLPKTKEKFLRVIVLNAGKCAWGKCLFCGWGRDASTASFASRHGQTQSEITQTLIEKFDREAGESDVKLFCSGSFLDSNQFPLEFQRHVSQAMQGRTLYVESRPEFVTKESLDLFKGVKLVVAMGLETADNEVLRKLCKGVTLEQLSDKAKLIHEAGFKVKFYILVNPPFDYPALLGKSVSFAREHGDEYVLINTYPHALSGLFDLWINGGWKPFSEDEFIDRAKQYADAQLEPNNYAFVPKFPDDKRADLRGVGIEFINHPHFNVWQEYIAHLYKKPEAKDIALFLPCSKKKPYYNSRTHLSVRRVIAGYPWYKRVHIIVISNPGVIPIEFADKYPFNSYDWNESLETPEVMREYIKINTQRVKDYLKTHNYKKVLSYFKPASESGLALENACKELGIKLVKLCDEELINNIKFEKNPLIHPRMIIRFKEIISKELTKDL